VINERTKHVNGANHSIFRDEMSERILLFLLFLAVALIGVLSYPGAISEPAASPEDKAREDLSRVEYPSLAGIAWRPHFIRPQDSLERLFGDDWVYVARFNRIDRRHAYPGVTIKVPENIEDIKEYTPLPLLYEPARPYSRYILIHMTEQWLGVYEFGLLKFSMPAATGVIDHPTPPGFFIVDALDRDHTSSLYKTEKGDAQYPMDYAIRFYVSPDNVAFWIHARDLPGRPASHGCVGVFDETMQRRTYGVPEMPVLDDARRLYEWVAGPGWLMTDTGGLRIIPDGPVVEVTGDLPRYLDAPPRRSPWVVRGS